MSFSKIRGILYTIAKYLGDVQAVQKAIKSGNIRHLVMRVVRRVYGKITGRGMGHLK